jgi:hypothetical protein
MYPFHLLARPAKSIEVPVQQTFRAWTLGMVIGTYVQMVTLPPNIQHFAPLMVELS